MNLPTVRLVRTTNGLGGESMIMANSALDQFCPLGPDGPAFSIIDVRPEVPVNNTNPPERSLFADGIPWCPANGVSVYVLDMPGGYKQSATHRTRSVDYVFILSGTVSLGLELEEVLLRAGDCVQIQGCEHRWMNKAEDPCRMLCFAAAAKEPILDHKTTGIPS